MTKPQPAAKALALAATLVLLGGVGVALIAGARSSATGTAASTQALAVISPFAVVRPTAQPTLPATQASIVASAATPQPTPSPTPAPPTALTAVTLEQCSLYSQNPQDLLTRVDRDVELPREYQPPDLAPVPLNSRNVYYGTILLRMPIHQPLLEMLEAMNQAGLRPWVMSGFRSYSDQALAFEKWTAEYPDRASKLSAVPGHSEHQLGTVVDFSTPYMDDKYGDYFNKRFAQTPEGQWLTSQAANYGFTLSYPQWAVDITGYEWEPWHFRYVGSLAQQLLENHVTLTEYIQKCSGGS